MKRYNFTGVLNASNFQVTPEQLANLQIIPKEDDPSTWVDNDPD